MSYTKALKKRLPYMSKADLACKRLSLEQFLLTEKNPMKRASYREQISIIVHEQERRWHEAEAESYIPKDI